MGSWFSKRGDHNITPTREFSFPSAYDYQNHHKRKNAVEYRIMSASQLIREKEHWREGLQSREFIKECTAEVKYLLRKTEEFHCVVDQLKYFNGLTKGLVEVAAVDGTWQADNIISEQLKSQFTEAVRDLLYKPNNKDYEPGSNNLVVNIIDPSLYCWVSGVTRSKRNAIPSLRYIGGGNKVAQIPRKTCGHTIETEFYKLLPADFHISVTGKVTINSYINNLHPINDQRLYLLIAEVFEYFIPLFNGVLNDLLCLRPAEHLNCSAKRRKEEDIVLAPSTKYDLMNRDIQVIVKMKSIELTPENPDFNGGDWHIEGIKTEYIVATGIYIYHTKNVTESRIYFRQNNWGNQKMGSIITSENRILAFPNICQHRVSYFELVDKKKPGGRDILVFFLIDPKRRIISTRDVPPQQMSWFNEELSYISPFNRLDSYTIEYITSFLQWPMSKKKARSYRDKLRAERNFKSVRESEEMNHTSEEVMNETSRIDK